MMNKIILLFAGCAIMVQAQPSADTSNWKHGLTGAVTATQVSYKDWSQGGENALAWTATLDGKSMYQLPAYQWTTTYNFAYGNTKIGTQSTRKTDDKIDIASEIKYHVGLPVDPYAAASFKTQFAAGYSYDAAGNRTAISDFYDPAFITLSIGASFQPSTEVKTRIGAAVREIITSTYVQYADDPLTPSIEKTKIEGGLESVSEAGVALDDNIVLKAKLELFFPLKKLEEVIVRSDNTITAKISKYFSTNLNFQFIHEKPISPRTQIKQTISLGFSYVLI